MVWLADDRFNVCQFPPYVYERLKQQGCGVVLVLNKVDMMPAPLVLAWKRYFEALCPGMQVVPFCSHERILDRRRKVQLALHSCRGLLTAVKAVAQPAVDLSSWEEQLEAAAKDELEITGDAPANTRHDACAQPDSDNEDNDEEEEEEEDSAQEEEDAAHAAGEDRDAKTFTVGTIGYPNVGKSSLINAILGQRKVSVSHTPGHTKHFQTHYLTQDRSVMLCDCPGLIFPAVCPYKLQVLSGTFPVSQVRAPMSVVGFLAAHINVPRALGLTFSQEYLEDCGAKPQWTPFYISEAWAVKRNYRIKGRGGRPDASRAANELVRFSLAGRQRLVLCLTPPHYCPDKFASDSAALAAIRETQGLHAAVVEQQCLLLQYTQRTTSSNSRARGSQHLPQDDHDSSAATEQLATVSNKYAALNFLSDEDKSTDSETETEDD
ncbi:GTP binding domain [Trinorchestia longiramus]|nr:GTP binding domain [Trinorchestia longiramus]